MVPTYKLIRKPYVIKCNKDTRVVGFNKGEWSSYVFVKNQQLFASKLENNAILVWNYDMVSEFSRMPVLKANFEITNLVRDWKGCIRQCNLHNKDVIQITY
jgi:hypothetical protein